MIDQAEGLRRLLAREGSRVIAVTGGPGAPGRTTVVVNLAAALTAQGKEVLVVDECLGALSVCAMLGGVRGAGNFAALMRGELALDEAVGRHALGFGVLAVSRENREHYTNTQLHALLGGSADVVLIDAQLDRDGALSPLALHAHDVVVVTRVAAQAITAAYACMKRLHFAHAIGQFRVLTNRVSSASDAQTAFDNLAMVARRYLGVAVEDAGHVAAEPHMPQALQLARCVVDAFPSTPAARDFRKLAAELPHWPMRPAVAARSPATARGVGAAVPGAAGLALGAVAATAPGSAKDAANSAVNGAANSAANGAANSVPNGAATRAAVRQTGSAAGRAAVTSAVTSAYAGRPADWPARRASTRHA